MRLYDCSWFLLLSSEHLHIAITPWCTWWRLRNVFDIDWMYGARVRHFPLPGRRKHAHRGQLDFGDSNLDSMLMLAFLGEGVTPTLNWWNYFYHYLPAVTAPSNFFQATGQYPISMPTWFIKELPFCVFLPCRPVRRCAPLTRPGQFAGRATAASLRSFLVKSYMLKACDEKLAETKLVVVRLWLQGDNACKEVRNSFTGRWATLLTQSSYFKSVSINHMEVGHTHEDIGRCCCAKIRKVLINVCNTLCFYRSLICHKVCLY